MSAHPAPQSGPVVLILGSAPSVVTCRDWPRDPFDTLLVMNNAWNVRADWDILIHPEDFPEDRRPRDVSPEQRIVEAETYVPAQNRYGGFVFAGGTMAFTAGYWALDALRPRVMAFLGCDMVYPASGNTHFYGKGAPDPLRDDISLRDLGAKSARLGMMAAIQGCACVNLSEAAESSLLFPRAAPEDLEALTAPSVVAAPYEAQRAAEAALGYDTPTGRYWETRDRYDPDALDQLDRGWRALYAQALG